jgi:hypothetical protein
MEYYSPVQKNECMSFAGKRMELENIMISNVSQVHKDKKAIFFSYMWKIYAKHKLYTNTNMITHIYLYIYLYSHTHNVSVTVELFERTWKKDKKRER